MASADQRLTELSSALLGLLGEVPGVPVVVDEDEVPVWPLVPVAPLVESVVPLVALEPIVELSLLPLVVSVVLQAARATQNAAANIVFIIAMIFPFVSGLKR
jgi:hypothetical protein